MVKRLALLLVIVLLVASSVHTTFLVRAEGKTIIVPDDYPTWYLAIENAKDGDTVLIKNGTYESPTNQTLVINKSITLQGENPENTTINLNPPLVPMSIFTFTYMGYAEPLKIQANNVKITGLTLKTPGGPILVESQSIEITNNIINTKLSVNGKYIKISNNTLNTPFQYSVVLSGSHQGILNNTLNGIHSRATYSIIAGNTITNSGVDGLVRIEATSNIIYDNYINADGWPGITLRLDVDEVIIAKNIIENSGLYIQNASNSIISGNIIKNDMGITVDMGENNVFLGNQLENNTCGIRLGYDQTDIARECSGSNTVNNTVFHNNFINNNQQAQDWNWLNTNQWSNNKEGNYWSDYTGHDWNFDGIGDSPYRLAEAVSYYAKTTQGTDHYPLMTPFDIKSITIELPKWATNILENTNTSDNKPEEPATIFPMTLIIIVLTVACMIIVVLLVYFVKKKIK
jgi:nitrous oxidase accessory protein